MKPGSGPCAPTTTPPRHRPHPPGASPHPLRACRLHRRTPHPPARDRASNPRLLEAFLLSTRSCIARPTPSGFSGIYVDWDGYPTNHLRLLLTAHQYQFARDTEAMARFLIDEVPVGWSGLGTDLLDGAPDSLRAELVGDEQFPSSQLDNLITPDGSPPHRMTINETSAGGLEWAYILHQHSLEVIALTAYERGPLVDWNTDPRSRVLDHPGLWAPTGPAPVTAPPRPARLDTANPAQPVPPNTRRSAHR